MGGGKGSSVPDTPDYVAVAKQEGQNNMQLANYLTNANRANQTTPYGSSTWSYDNSAVQQAYDEAYASANNAKKAAMAKQGVDAWGSANNLYGTWNQATTLSDAQQAILDASQSNQLTQQNLATGLLDQASSTLGTAFDPTLDAYQQAQGYGTSATGLPDNTLSQFSNLDENTSNYYDQAAQALYDKTTQFMGDQYTKDEAAERQRLASLGLQEGSAAYTNAMDQFQRNKNAAYETAGLDAILQGYNVGTQNLNNLLNTRSSNVDLQSGIYNQNLSNYSADQQERVNAANNSLALAQQAAAQRQQQYNEQLTSRELPINEYAAMLNGSSVTYPSFDSYNQATGYDTADLMGATQAQYAADMNSYNSSQSQKSSLLGAGSGLLGTYLGSK